MNPNPAYPFCADTKVVSVYAHRDVGGVVGSLSLKLCFSYFRKRLVAGATRRMPVTGRVVPDYELTPVDLLIAAVVTGDRLVPFLSYLDAPGGLEGVPIRIGGIPLTDKESQKGQVVQLRSCLAYPWGEREVAEEAATLAAVRAQVVLDTMDPEEADEAVAIHLLREGIGSEFPLHPDPAFPFSADTRVVNATPHRDGNGTVISLALNTCFPFYRRRLVNTGVRRLTGAELTGPEFEIIEDDLLVEVVVTGDRLAPFAAYLNDPASLDGVLVQVGGIPLLDRDEEKRQIVQLRSALAYPLIMETMADLMGTPDPDGQYGQDDLAATSAMDGTDTTAEGAALLAQENPDLTSTNN